MSTNEPPRSPPPAGPGYPRSRLPFETNITGSVVQRSSVVLYGLLALALAGTALYMGLLQHMPLTSAYVVAPAIGAAWFALRVFMMIAPKR